MKQYETLLDLVVNEFEHWPALVGFMGQTADGRLHMNAGHPDNNWGRLICHSRDAYPGVYEGEVTRTQWEAAKAAKKIVEHAVVLIHKDGLTTTTAYKNVDDAFKHYMALITDGKKVVMEARRKGEAPMDFKC